MPKFLVLIYETEAGPGEQDSALQAEYARHWTFIEQHGDAIVASQALEPTSTAVCLRKDADGRLVVTDGPFVETKEALGGFYLLEAVDLDAAKVLAGQIPAPAGGVEIRPIMVFDN